jgi:hypothetical protein
MITTCTITTSCCQGKLKRFLLLLHDVKFEDSIFMNSPGLQAGEMGAITYLPAPPLNVRNLRF